MGVTLISESEHSVHYNWTTWGKLLELAKVYGWIPEGTEPRVECEKPCREEPDSEPWCGSYYSNDGQWLTRSDVIKLVNALERAMQDYAQVRKHPPDAKELSHMQQDKIASLLENNRFPSIVAEFIWFSSKGRFCIY